MANLESGGGIPISENNSKLKKKKLFSSMEVTSQKV